jgi:hypothetical protein
MVCIYFRKPLAPGIELRLLAFTNMKRLPSERTHLSRIQFSRPLLNVANIFVQAPSDRTFPTGTSGQTSA